MRSYRKWVLSLGLAAALAPGLSLTHATTAQAAETSNQQLADHAAQALRAAKLSGFDIGIEVQDGVCVLQGKIGSNEQKAMASKAVSQVPGIRQVDNRLKIEERTIQPVSGQQTGGGVERANFMGFGSKQPAAAPSGPQNQKTAESIAAAIKQSGIRGHNLDLKFSNGVATLDGTVAAPQHVGQLTQVVSRVPGVRQVENHLNVAGQRPASRPSSPNQMVAEQIAGALAQSGLSTSDIEVRYNNGTATLRGIVGHPQAAAAAEEIASQVPGVQAVSNQIQVAARPQAPIQQVSFQDPGMPPGAGGPMPPMAPPGMAPGMPGMGMPGMGMQGPMHGGRGQSHMAYDMPHLPAYSWPTYSSYPNYASLQYPTQYSASAWPYIGPFYPYPQVPLGWRKVELEWDDGYWNLNFNSRTDKWFWFLDSKNW